MKYCSNCGKQIKADAGFCPYCGTKQNNKNTGKNSERTADNHPKEPGQKQEPNMINSFMETWNHLFSFKGRMSRAAYWWSFLDFFLLGIAVIFLSSLSMGVYYSGVKMVSVILLLPCAFYGAVAFVGGICNSVRRLHDENLSGWLWWLSIIPFFGSIILLILMVMPANNENNRFNQQDNGRWYHNTGLIIAIIAISLVYFAYFFEVLAFGD